MANQYTPTVKRKRVAVKSIPSKLPLQPKSGKRRIARGTPHEPKTKRSVKKPKHNYESSDEDETSDYKLRRHVMITDFGAYLKQLRLERNMTQVALAELVNYTPMTIKMIESSKSPPPTERRLRIWLNALGMSKKLPEALRLLRSVKRSRRVLYHINDKINEHLDRILDAYDNHTLTPMDKDLISMIALQEYSRGNIPDPDSNRFEIEEPIVKDSSKNTAASQLGKQGGLVGGKQRAKNLSSTERSAIAAKGGQAKANAAKKKAK